MNSLKREKQDRTLAGLHTHIIRSHRRPPTHVGRRVITTAALIGVCFTLGPTDEVHSASAARVPIQPATVIADAPEPLDPRFPRVQPVKTAEAVREVCVRCTRIETVINYALAQQGDPYQWNRSGPNSFDCSGLVLAAYARVGIALPHYTGWIIGHGQRINRVQLQRGDIVFPSSHHVGIYLGGGKIVHASSSQGGVAVSKLYSFYAARRLV